MTTYKLVECDNTTHQLTSTPTIHRHTTPYAPNVRHRPSEAPPIPRHRPSRGNTRLPTDNPLSPLGIAHNGLHVQRTPCPPARHHTAAPPTDAKSSEPRGHRTSRPPAHRERPPGTRHQNHEHSAQPARCTHTQQSTEIDQHQHTPISRRARINATTTPNPKTRKTNP